MVNDQDFPKLTGGTRQRGGLDNVEYGIYMLGVEIGLIDICLIF